jgi:hypothetical protein
VKRREFLVGGASMAWPLTAVAQSRKPATLGILVARNPDPTRLIKGIKEGLRDLGYVEGTANALGLTLPANLLTRADDVIE